MKTFEYEIKNSSGLHARPAGKLVRMAGDFQSSVTIEGAEKKSNVKSLIPLMYFGAKCGDKVKITIDGADEERAYEDIKSFFEENL